MEKKKKTTGFAMFLVTIGIVYGDIGTSPLYVMKSILEGNGGIGNTNTDFIVGSLSLVIWTITLLTTVKYVLIAMRADNNGEGGIFSLYSLVRKTWKWLIFPAMVGGAALLADGVLTPAVTVTTAIEGLRSIEVMERFLGAGQGKVIIITLLIITALFSVQRAGTSKIGRAFGPVMLIWFSFLGITGASRVFLHPVVLKAFNPLYAVKVLLSPYNKAGLMILGSVFLAATGAEALYSDMGHVGKSNIHRSWPFVKACLILNYLGQGAWILQNNGDAALLAMGEVNPFFQMLPPALRPVAVLLSTLAAIIASQALITGSYTLVSEAIRLDLLPHLKVNYPSDTKGQLYIGTVNGLLFVGCSLVVLYFRSSARMEAAYGLAITVTMLMTTLLLFVYLFKILNQKVLAVTIALVFGAIEAVFFFSSLGKFAIGGYVTVIIALLLFSVMVIWHRGTQLEKEHSVRLRTRDYISNLATLRADKSVPLCAQNLVYVEKSTDAETLDRDTLYSILDKDPKRAQAYWFISIRVLDEPRAARYRVETFGTDFVFRVVLELGFRNHQRLNVYIRQIVGDLLESGELPPQERKFSIYENSNVGNFKFCFLRRSVASDAGLTDLDRFVLTAKYSVRQLIGSRIQWYGLDTSSLIMETVPLVVSAQPASGQRPIRAAGGIPETAEEE
ncbi:MAG: KUP/HAK/KT family potassium transporter [Oscillospiraceae bacterium]|nr:KUP/HAK/KT family potassium transporter [Oscillospiraceae bacterium]